MPRCKICRKKFEVSYFLQKTCSKECESEYQSKQEKKEVQIKEWKPKPKTCKGTGEAKGFGCGKLVPQENRKYGLGLECCYSTWLFNSTEGKLKQEKLSLKQESSRTPSSIKPTKELQLDSKKQDLIEKLRSICHRYIRERDRGLPCISCGKPWSEDFQAGHFLKSELYSGLRFDERNIYGQCPECNCFKDGNIGNYRKGLLLRIGEEVYIELFKESLNNKFYRWEREELEELVRYYNFKFKQLKDG